MPKRKVKMEAIEGKAKRHTTFTKRRHGLEKKTEEFCRKSESEAVIITFSNVGNPYLFAYPHMDDVFARYSSTFPAEPRTSAAEEAAVVETLIAEAVEMGDWSEAIKDLKLEQLDRLSAGLNDVMLMAEKIAAAKIHPGFYGGGGFPGAGSSA